MGAIGSRLEPCLDVGVWHRTLLPRSPTARARGSCHANHNLRQEAGGQIFIGRVGVGTRAESNCPANKSLPRICQRRSRHGQMVGTRGLFITRTKHPTPLSVPSLARPPQASIRGEVGEPRRRAAVEPHHRSATRVQHLRPARCACGTSVSSQGGTVPPLGHLQPFCLRVGDGNAWTRGYGGPPIRCANGTSSRAAASAPVDIVASSYRSPSPQALGLSIRAQAFGKGL